MGFFSGSNETKKYLDQANQNRDKFNQQGDKISGDLADQAGYYNTNEQAYQQQGDEAYQELRDNPGYTSDEMAGVLGDPNAAFKYYDPGELNRDTYKNIGDISNAATNYGGGIRDSANRAGAGLNVAADAGAGGLRSAAGKLGTGMRSAADEYGAGLNSAADEYGAGLNSSVDNMRAGLNAPANDQLAWQGGVYNYQRGEGEAGLDEYGQKLDSATSRDNLGLSKNFATDYAFTDADAQNMKDIAAQATAGQYRKMGDQARLRAAAQGNTSPAAMAAIEANLGAQGAAEAGDAATRAAMAANQERAKRVQDIEGMRLGSEQDISSRQTANAGNIYKGQIGAAQNLAALEQQGIQSATGNRMQAATDLGKYGYDAANATGQARINAATATGQARMDAAKTAGVYGYNAENDAANLGYKAASDSGAYDYKATDQGGQAAMDATRYGADTLLANDRANQTVGQGLATGADAAGVARNTNIANVRRAGQADYRGYLTDAQKLAQSGSQATEGQRINEYGDQSGAVNNATATATRAAQAQDAKPSGFSKLIGAASGIAGAVVPGINAGKAIGGLIPKKPNNGTDYSGYSGLE